MIGTSIVYEGHVYAVGINGVAECLEFATGKAVWTQRLAASGLISTTSQCIIDSP